MATGFETWIPFARHYGKYIYSVSSNVLIAGEADKLFSFIVNKTWKDIREKYPLKPKYFRIPQESNKEDYKIAVDGEIFYGCLGYYLYVENEADKWRQGRCYIINWLARNARSYCGSPGVAPTIVEELKKNSDFKIELIVNHEKKQELPEHLKGNDIDF